MGLVIRSDVKCLVRVALLREIGLYFLRVLLELLWKIGLLHLRVQEDLLSRTIDKRVLQTCLLSKFPSFYDFHNV